MTGFTGLTGYFCCFFPFPEEREKDNPPSAEAIQLSCLAHDICVLLFLPNNSE
jgi:hypothetical protein